VVTVCDAASEECPFWLGKGKRVHHSFRDPIHARGTDEEVLQAFRNVREAMENEIIALLETYGN
jgi:arsenate reductase